jgi:hypothetical protein
MKVTVTLTARQGSVLTFEAARRSVALEEVAAEYVAGGLAKVAGEYERTLQKDALLLRRVVLDASPSSSVSDVLAEFDRRKAGGDD